MAEIAIYGGSFNPPTIAHEAAAAACLAQPDIDQVWLVPSGDRLDKHYSVTDEDRLRMLELMTQECFAGEARLHVSDFELQLPRPTQTWRTARALQVAYPEHNFHFVFGADAYRDMPRWHRGEELQRSLSLFVITRGNIAVPDDVWAQLLHIPVRSEVSATEVRKRIAQGCPYANLVCSAVRGYIERHQLYR